jgi:hypothetical protein
MGLNSPNTETVLPQIELDHSVLCEYFIFGTAILKYLRRMNTIMKFTTIHLSLSRRGIIA